MATQKILSFRVSVEGVSQEAKELVQLDQALAALNEERKESNQLVKQANADLKKRIITQKEYEQILKKESQKLGELKSKTKDLQVQKTELNKTERLSAQAFKAADGSMEKLRRDTAKLRKEAEQLNLSTESGRKKMKALQQQIIANTKTIRNYDRGISGSKTLVGEYAKGGVQAFQAIAGGILAAVAVMRTFSRLVGGGVKGFAEFQKGQANVQTLLDENNKALGGETIKLIRNYGLEVADVNKALFDAVSAGVPAAESAIFMQKATVLAKGGVTDLGTAVDGLTSVLNAYGLSYEETERVASAFFSAQKFGKTTVAELSAEIGKVAPVATQLDVTYQELLSTYAILTKQGIDTATSTTAIKAIMTGLLKPTEKAAEVFDDLGIAYGAAGVKQAGFGKVLQDVAEAVESGNSELAQLFPNVRALVGAGALGVRQLEEYDEILRTVNADYGEGSSLSRAYNLQLATLTESMGRIKQGFKTAQFAIGEFFEPAIKGFADLVFPMEQASEAISDQAIALQTLGGELATNWEDEDKRKTLLLEITEAYPNLLAGMNLEQISLGELQVKLREANLEYLQRIVLQQEQEKIDKARAKEGKKYNKQLDAQIVLEISLAKAATKLGITLADIPGTYHEQLVAIKDLAKEQGVYQDVLNDGILQSEDLETAFTNYSFAVQTTGFATLNLAEIQELAQQKADILFGTQEEGTDVLTEQQQILKDLTDGTINYAQAQERLAAAGLTGVVPSTAVVTTEEIVTTTKDKPLTKAEIAAAAKAKKEAEKFALESAKLQATLEIEIEKNRIAQIEDLEEQAWSNEVLRNIERVEALEAMAVLHPELQVQIDEALAAEKELHEFNISEIQARHAELRTKKQLEEDEKIDESDKKTQEAKIARISGYLQIAGDALNAFSKVFAAAKKKELSAVGDNAEAREAIERKFAKREQAIALGKAAISISLAILKVIHNPFLIALTSALGAVQLATIASQKFAAGGIVQAEEGGKVQTGSEITGMPRGGDNTLAMVKPGEVILNRRQQISLGGPESFRRIGVPGFAAGGIVPDPEVSKLGVPDLTYQISAAISQIPVILNMHEVRDANERMDVIAETSGV